MHHLQNHLLKIAIKPIGAELCSITSVKDNREFMWNGEAKVWSGIAPNLFPIIGCMKNDTYLFENKTYHMPKHGFVRKSSDLKLISETENSLTFKINSNEKLLEWFPFQFEFYITYTINDNAIEVTYTTKNCDDKPMYFSVGGHPAFKCPVYNGENYSDYSLEFSAIENSKTQVLNLDTGLLTSKTKPVFNNSSAIPLHYDLFNEDALIFKDLISRKVTLTSKNHGAILSVRFDDFNYLGVWAKPNANYVCIEPWLGIADHENTNQNIITKDGIIKLGANSSHKASYHIEIGRNHLV